MLYRLSKLNHYAIQTLDGTFGVVTGFYCDEQLSRVNYIVVELGSWAASRKVLINSSDITDINTNDRTFVSSLSIKQLRSSPSDHNTDLVTPQNYFSGAANYTYPSEWSDPQDEINEDNKDSDSSLSFNPLPHATLASKEAIVFKAQNEALKNTESQLKFFENLINFDIQATDDRLGSLEDFLIDETNWQILYLVVTTSRWWDGHQVLITPGSIKYTNWSDRIICLQLTHQQGLHSPIYDSNLPIKRERELGAHFGRNGFSKCHNIYAAKMPA